MISSNVKKLRLGIALLGAGTAVAAMPAAAQVQQQPAAREDAGTALTRHLRTLSEQPRSLTALTGAGKAALDLGDPQAALTFFARAEEIAPRDGRVKAGMGSAFLQMEQPQTAMRLFTEAAGLGVAEAEFAGDRGLVHDLAGDPRRAQADYNLALRREENAEVRRRLALSLAISGEADKAVAAIDAQLRRQDRAAWRTRAFILALAGDAPGALKAAQAVMPQQAAQLQPFFARLPALSPAQRAMAVHFGHFPEGQPLQAAGTQYASASPTPAPTQAGRPDSTQRRLGAQPNAAARAEAPKPRAAGRAEAPNPGSAETRRPTWQAPSRSSRPSRAASRREQKPVQIQAVPVETAAVPAPETTQAQPGLGQVVQLLEAQRDVPAPAAAPTPPAPAPTAPAQSERKDPPAPEPAQVEQQPPAPLPQQQPSEAQDQPKQPAAQANSIQTTSLPPSIVAIPDPAPAEPRQQASETEATAAPTPAPTAAAQRIALADLAAAIAALPDDASAAPASPRATQLAEARLRPPAPAARPKPETAKPPAAKTETVAKKPPAEKAAPAKGEPSRHWVQIAGGANEAAMSQEFKRLKGKAPKLLASMTPWTTPLRATNRLLVGPFKTPKEAQEFVNELAKLDLAAFSWTSPAGQAIAKLSGK